MNRFLIPESESQPGILFDPEKKIFRIWGKAAPEDAFEFYQPAIDWLEKYLATNPENIIFEFAIDYYNTASSKVLLKILQMLEQFYRKNKNVKVYWYYLPDDEDMLIAGEDYRELVELPFYIKPRR